MEKEKILAMLTSNEASLVRLGAILALGMGPEWCLEFFRETTMGSVLNPRGRHTYPIIPVSKELRGKKYVKEGICISFVDNYVKCDYFYRLHPSMNMYDVIDLDKEEEEET